MISIAPSVLALAAALGGAAEPPPAGLQFELTTLSGRRQAGLLTDLTSDSVSLSVSGKTTTVPLGEVLDLRAVSSKSAQATVDLRRPELTLTDGSHLFFTGLRVNERGAQVETTNLGPFLVPLNSLAGMHWPHSSRNSPMPGGSWRRGS